MTKFFLMVSFLVITNFGSEDKVPSYLWEFGNAKHPTREIVLPISGDVLVEVSDVNGIPLYYYKDLDTGVCADSVCLPVSVRLYWDVCGHYLAYQVPKSRPLTKLNHVEYTNDDYRLLHAILNDPETVFKDIKQKDLVKKTACAEVDGITGSTIPQKEQKMVKGAAYTCYTLWHRVHNTEISNAIRKQHSEKVDLSLPDKSKDWKAVFKTKASLSCTQLAALLNEAHQRKLLTKFAFQNILMQNIDQLSQEKRVLIFNYLSRQHYLFPDIEQAITKTNLFNT